MANPPFVSPRFQQVGDVLEYKPFPSYPTWLVAYDGSGFTGDISELETAVTNAQTDATSALANAATALTAANEADDTADAAQSTANTALANAATALTAANEAADTADAAQSTANTALANAATALAAIPYPNTAFLHPLQFKAITNAWGAFAKDDAQSFNGSWVITGNGSNGFVEINLKAANYVLVPFVIRYVGSAIVEWLVDNVVKSTQDYYSAGAVYNYAPTTNFTIAASGIHKIGFNINGKNAAANAYSLALSFILIRQV